MANMHWDEFVERFRPEANFIANNGSDLFETYGPELAYVRAINGMNPGRVWTMVDGDDGQIVITSGYHFVNRIAYIITEVPCPDGEFIEVLDD